VRLSEIERLAETVVDRREKIHVDAMRMTVGIELLTKKG
jgi:hypothetical protein